MRVLLVSVDNSKTYKIGGKHIHQELLERAFGELGHQVDTAYPDDGNTVQIRVLKKVNRLLGRRNSYRLFRLKQKQKSTQLVQKVRALVAAHRYDMVSVQDPPSCIIVSDLLKDASIHCPVVMTLHGYYANETVNYGYYQGTDAKKVHEMCRTIESRAAASSDCIVTVDNRIRTYVQEAHGVPDNKLTVLHNAVDTNLFSPVDRNQQRTVRRQLGLPEEGWIALVARRLVKKNGVEYAVKACDLVSQGGAPIHLVIAGEGPEQAHIEQLIRSSHSPSSIRYLGRVDHEVVHDVFLAADIILMPSIRSDEIEEATSLTMLEGMACGKVVVASAIGGLKEVIRSGENGILVPDQDEQALAAAITHLINAGPDEFARLSECAVRDTRAGHSYLTHAQRFLQIVAESVSGRKP